MLPLAPTPPSPPASPALAQIARHFSNSISDNFEEQISFEYCRQRVHEYLKNVSACKKLSTVSDRVHYSSVFCEHLIPVPMFAKEISHKSMPQKGCFIKFFRDGNIAGSVLHESFRRFV